MPLHSAKVKGLKQYFSQSENKKHKNPEQKFMKIKINEWNWMIKWLMNQMATNQETTWEKVFVWKWFKMTNNGKRHVLKA